MIKRMSIVTIILFSPKGQGNVIREETWIRYTNYLKRGINWSEFTEDMLINFPKARESTENITYCASN